MNYVSHFTLLSMILLFSCMQNTQLIAMNVQVAQDIHLCEVCSYAKTDLVLAGNKTMCKNCLTAILVRNNPQLKRALTQQEPREETPLIEQQPPIQAEQRLIKCCSKDRVANCVCIAFIVWSAAAVGVLIWRVALEFSH